MQHLDAHGFGALIFIACVFLVGFVVDGAIARKVGKEARDVPDGMSWFLSPVVPREAGWYWTQNHFEECDKYWNGEKWQYSQGSKAVCYYQRCDFIGPTEKVSL